MINLQIINDFDDKIKLSNKSIIKIISNIISNESKYDKASILLIIADDEYLRNLKIKYFNMDIFTDVITFDLSDDNQDLDAEIYISWERINENAKKYKQELDKELRRMIVHGCLHLMGFNDLTEQEIKQMRKKEKEYLENSNSIILSW